MIESESESENEFPLFNNETTNNPPANLENHTINQPLLENPTPTTTSQTIVQPATQSHTMDQVNSPPSDDDQAREEDNLVDVAVISALTNVKNCLKRGSFTKTSIINFKKNNPSLITALIADGGDVAEVEDWLILLSEKTAILDEVSQSSCLNILLNIQTTYPKFIFPDEIQTQWFSYNFTGDDDETTPSTSSKTLISKDAEHKIDTVNTECDIQVALVAAFHNIASCIDTDLDFHTAISNFKKTHN